MAKNFQLSYASATVLVVFLIVLPSISAHDKPSPPVPSSPQTDEDFLVKSCNVTPYPGFCIGGLPSYNINIKQNPFRLAFYAVRISKMSAEAAATFFTQMDVQVQLLAGLNLFAEAQNLLVVVHECSSSFKTAADLKFRALRQMGQLNNPSSSSECKVEMSNVQTWLSDALTNEEKCIERLGSLSLGTDFVIKSQEAIESTSNERKITCNALALVKDFSCSPLKCNNICTSYIFC